MQAHRANTVDPKGLPENLFVPQAALRLAQEFIKTNDANQILLADMLYYGNSAY